MSQKKIEFYIPKKIGLFLIIIGIIILLFFNIPECFLLIIVGFIILLIGIRKKDIISKPIKSRQDLKRMKIGLILILAGIVIIYSSVRLANSINFISSILLFIVGILILFIGFIVYGIKYMLPG